MKNACIGVFEDDMLTRTLFRKVAERYGHNVVAEASNMNEILSIIQNLDDNSMDVAIVEWKHFAKNPYWRRRSRN